MIDVKRFGAIPPLDHYCYGIRDDSCERTPLPTIRVTHVSIE